MYVVKTSKPFQATKECTAQVITLRLMVLYASPPDFSFSLPCNSAQGHAVPCTVAGKQKVLKNVVSKVVYTRVPERSLPLNPTNIFRAT